MKQMLKLKFLSLLCLPLLTCSIVSAQENRIAISGSVIDAGSRKPLADANISFYKTGTSQPSTVSSSEKGKFLFHVTDSGSYTISISHTGFKQAQFALTLQAGMKEWELGAISLQKGEGMLAEVVVKTDKPLVEQRADRLVYNADKDLSTLGGTAADVLRNVPMVSVDGDGNVQLKGSSNLRVLINNRPSTIIAATIADALRQLPADLIKSVEVITSPSAKYDADGTAGIINIITKKNLMQGVTGTVVIVPGNVSTIGNAGLNFRRRKIGLSFSAQINQFYNTGKTWLERFTYSDQSLFIQDGRTKNNSGFVSPRFGFDYTFNDRNSISGGVGYNPSYNKVRNNQHVSTSKPSFPVGESDLFLFNHTKDKTYDFNFDYLRSFKDPQQEFSFLTLYSISNSDNIANQDETNKSDVLIYQQRNLNKSTNRETTFQTDYTQPFKNKSTIEVGLKTILRKASSDVSYRSLYQQSGIELSSKNVFSYDQDVKSAYLLYGFRLFEKINLKIGGRYEKTTIDAHFVTKDFSFRTDYDNLIPSFNASYSIRNKHSFRAGYTQRLQRPQLYFLNPYREVLSPKIIREGNPELDAETAGLYELGYGYNAKFSVYTNLYARITNNAISSSLSVKNDTTYIHFLNIARNKTYGISVSGNVKPVKAWALNGNVNFYYAELNGDGISNDGWMYNIFVGSNIDLGKGWGHSFTGSFNSRRVTLQGRMAAFYYHNTAIRKEIFKKRGAIGINLANPLMRGTRVRNNIATAMFEQRENNINYTRGVRLQISYRFGSLQQARAPRKAKKSINNDDALRGQ